MRNPEFFSTLYAPTTTKIAFFKIGCDEMAQAFFEWSERINTQFGLAHTERLERLTDPLEKKLIRLLPLAKGRENKRLMLPTKSAWTAFMTNGFYGGDIHSPVSYMGEKLKVVNLSIVMVADVPGSQPGSTQFVFRDMTSEPHKIRSIIAHRESRWEWNEYGESLPYEETERYKAKKIKDRLTPEMVERYCRHLGIDLFDPDFYEGDGYMVHSYSPPNVKFISHFPNQVSKL